VLEERKQRIPICGDVQHPERHPMEPELAPGEQFEQLIERSGAARHRDHGVR
jgi:hypothetical protein